MSAKLHAVPGPSGSTREAELSELRFIMTSLFVIITVVLAILYTSLSIGGLWAEIDANSLVGLQALIEKNVDPDLWLDIVLPVLGFPLWIATGVISVLLLLLRRRRASRHRI